MKRTLLRNIFSDEVTVHDKKFKSIEERLVIVEKNIPNIKNKLSELSNKRGEEVKCFDKIVPLLLNYSDSEKHESLKINIKQFAECLKGINEEFKVLNDTFDKNVVSDLAEFKVRSKHLRNDLKTALATSEEETLRKKQLQRLQMLRDQDVEKLSTAEADYLKAKGESSKGVKLLEQNGEMFEQKKLAGMRASLLMWATLELKYHARALELFTEAYRAAAQIDVDSDLETYRGKMYTRESASRLATVESTTRQHINSTLQNGQDVQRFLSSTPTSWSINRSSSRLSSSTFDSSR